MLNRLNWKVHLFSMYDLPPYIYGYFTKMAFSGSRISLGIFSDYPRYFNLQAAETSWLFLTSLIWNFSQLLIKEYTEGVSDIKFQLTFNQRIYKRCVSLQGRPWKIFEVISSKALPVRAMRVIFTMPTNLLSKAI